MLPRVIPLLLLLDEALVKTVQYSAPRYVGDPTNVINLFNQFEVDEIALLDIGATGSGRGPNYELVRELAEECWVPLSYGGGITSVDHARRVLASGAEKVVIGTALADEPSVVTAVAEVFGSQAVVASVDAKPADGEYSVFVENGRRRIAYKPDAYAARAVDLGAGEILLNAIHRDGTMDGYDVELIERVAGAVNVPVVAAGGAGSRGDLAAAIAAGASAAAAGSIFVFSGRAGGVLVNFPTRPELEALLG